MAITEIVKRNGTVIKLNTQEPFCVVKSATQNSSLMGDDYITLQIVSTEWLSFDKGDKIVVDGFDYTIRTTTKREIQGDDYYIFEPVFYGPMYDLMKTLYRNTDREGKSDRCTFDLTYTIKEFVQVIINNLNRDYPGLWAFDENNCPETEAKTIQFSGVNCLQALQSLCSKDNFNLEFLISQENSVRTIHIGEFGQRVNPPGGADYFEWGKGNGLYKLTEQKIDDKAIITRLWAEGGTSNIRTDYRNYSERLQLPYPRRYNSKRHILFDGTVVEPDTELIGIDDDNKRYIEDAALRDKIGSEEDSKTYDEIFPTRPGVVTALVADDINAFIDDTMDFDLCEKDADGTKYLVDGVNAKITFTSGRLAGQQFELEAKGGYDHATKKFKLIPFTDNRGLTTPTVSVEQGGAYPIEVGASYKITDIFLPESYEHNAEEDLWYAAYNDFKPATQAKAQYSLTLDRLYFLEALSRDSEVCLFKVGDYVPVKDTRYGIEKQIRIQKITRNLLLEQDYQLTLSDTTAISVQTQTVLSVIEHEQIITNNRLRDLNKARRAWRTTEDLRNMVYDTDGFFNVDNIRPNSIDTNMLTVGSKSQQFVLTGVVLQANFGGDPNSFAASAGILSHLTIDPTRVRAWEMGALSFNVQSVAGYYLFAKCSKSGDKGTWLLTQTQYKFEPADDPNNYYFLVGILSSLYTDDNFRDFQTTYGFTRINGNTITTGRIVTSDDMCYLDLDGNKFKIGDKSSSIDWNVSRANCISLKNVSVVSESGDVSPLGVYRGVWNESYIYYTNDEVTYAEKGAVCTYRYIHPMPSKGHKPTDSTYWCVIAKGADGAKGTNADSNRLVYRYSFDKPERPVGDTLAPAGWSDTPDRENFEIVHGSNWALQDGYYKSPAIDHNGITTNRISFVTTKPNQMLAIEIWAQSEGGYDFALVGKLDTEGLTRTSNYIDRVSGPDMKKVVYIDIPAPGEHFIDVAYAKDGSNSYGSDCGRYRIVNVPNCWISIGTVSGATAKVVAWSDPMPFSIDSADVERIYRLMPSETEPPTPQSDPYTDDYVPLLSTEIHVEGQTYAKGQIVIGADGLFYECTATSTTNTPVIPSAGGGGLVGFGWKRVCGWTDNPEDVSASYRFQYECVRKKTAGVWGAFSKPVLWMVLPNNGADGADGAPGDFIEYRYAKSGSKTNYDHSLNPFNATGAETPGAKWSTIMPPVERLEYLWLTMGRKSGATKKLIGTWSDPIRVNPYDGVDGKDGKPGPSMLFRGEYDPGKTYYGNAQRVDCVKYRGVYYIASVTAGAFYNVLPTASGQTKWNMFDGSFESVATQLLLAEFAYIENLGVRDLLTNPSGKRVHISRDRNAITVYDEDDAASIVIAGETLSDEALFGGASTSVAVPKTTITPVCTSNTSQVSTKTCGSFVFNNNGAFIGSVQLALSMSVNQGTLSAEQQALPNRPAKGTLEILLDGNKLLASESISAATGETGSIAPVNKSFTFNEAITPGNHTITAKLSYTVPVLGTGGSMSLSGSATFSNCKADSEIRQSNYFANGNAIGCSSTQYSQTIMESGKLMHKVEAGNVGIRFYNGSLRFKIGGVWYEAARNTSTGAITLNPLP